MKELDRRTSNVEVFDMVQAERKLTGVIKQQRQENYLEHVTRSERLFTTKKTNIGQTERWTM